MKKRRVRNKTTGIEGRGASSVTPRQMAAHQRLSALLQAGLLSDGVHFLSVRQGKPILLKAGAEMVMLACGSVSTSSTFFPSRAIAAPMLMQLVVFATPPF